MECAPIDGKLESEHEESNYNIHSEDDNEDDNDSEYQNDQNGNKNENDDAHDSEDRVGEASMNLVSKPSRPSPDSTAPIEVRPVRIATTASGAQRRQSILDVLRYMDNPDFIRGGRLHTLYNPVNLCKQPTFACRGDIEYVTTLYDASKLKARLLAREPVMEKEWEALIYDKKKEEEEEMAKAKRKQRKQSSKHPQEECKRVVHEPKKQKRPSELSAEEKEAEVERAPAASATAITVFFSHPSSHPSSHPPYTLPQSTLSNSIRRQTVQSAIPAIATPLSDGQKVADVMRYHISGHSKQYVESKQYQQDKIIAAEVFDKHTRPSTGDVPDLILVTKFHPHLISGVMDMLFCARKDPRTIDVRISEG